MMTPGEARTLAAVCKALEEMNRGAAIATDLHWAREQLNEERSKPGVDTCPNPWKAACIRLATAGSIGETRVALEDIRRMVREDSG